MRQLLRLGTPDRQRALGLMLLDRGRRADAVTGRGEAPCPVFSSNLELVEEIEESDRRVALQASSAPFLQWTKPRTERPPRHLLEEAASGVEDASRAARGRNQKGTHGIDQQGRPAWRRTRTNFRHGDFSGFFNTPEVVSHCDATEDGWGRLPALLHRCGSTGAIRPIPGSGHHVVVVADPAIDCIGAVDKVRACPWQARSPSRIPSTAEVPLHD